MFSTKIFAFFAIVLIVLVQIGSIQAGDDEDTIIFGGGHGCPPHFLLKDGKFTYIESKVLDSF